MSGSKNLTFNSNNNNNAKKSAVLPSRFLPPQKGSFYRYEEPSSSANVALPVVRHSKPPPTYTQPDCAKIGTSLAQTGTPRERRRQDKITGQNAERSGRKSPGTLSRSYSLDQMHRKPDVSIKQKSTDYHSRIEPQKTSNTIVTSTGDHTLDQRTGRNREYGSARNRSNSVTKPLKPQYNGFHHEDPKPQITRESRSRERDSSSSVRRSHSLNRTNPQNDTFTHTTFPSSLTPDHRVTTTSKTDLPPASSMTHTGNRTSSNTQRLPPETSCKPIQRSNSLIATTTSPTASYHTPPYSVVTTASYSTQSTVRKDNETAGDVHVFPESGGKVGISNLGNTCFMNSMLQCLGQTGEMTHIFLRNMTPTSNQSLVRAYRELMQQMWSSSSEGSSRYTYTTGTIYPRSLKESFSRKNPQFSGFNQHDSQEFMRFLLCGLHEELKKPQTKPDIPRDEDADQWWKWYRRLEASDLFDVFVGQLCSSLKCDNCKKTSLTFDPFWELSVSLPKRHSSTHSSSTYHYATSYSSSYSSVSVEDCLATFTEEETLTGEERPYCDSCKSQQKAFKKMTIQRLPPVLVIHLKRFSGYGRRSKLDTTVTIPHTLDVHNYMSKTAGDRHSTPEYELYAVSNHSGTVYFGHYTAWCKHYSTNKWYSYNDCHVSPVTVQSPKFSSSTAYVLFYRKKKKVTAI